MLPFAYVLMSHKDEISYESVFTFFRDELNIWPNEVMMDFEKASGNALRKTYLGIVIIRCYFHFCQCLRSRSQQDENLLSLIKCNLQAGKCVRLFMALALLPEALVAKGFEVRF